MNRYDVMKLSNVPNNEGGFYYDPFTIPLDSFKITKNPLQYSLREIDKNRFDLLMFKAYGTSTFDDIVLLLNNVEHLNEVETDTTVYFPDRADVDSFFLENG